MRSKESTRSAALCSVNVGTVIHPGTPQRRLTIGSRFEQNEQGELLGFIDSPDQGMTGAGARIKKASFQDDELSIASDLLRLEYKGRMAGDE